MPEALLAWLDMGLGTWLGCAVTLALGAFVQRATGFGLAVVGAPLLLMLEPRLVPVILVLFGFTVALTTLRHYWREVRLAEIGTALVGRIPGNALGLWLRLMPTSAATPAASSRAPSMSWGKCTPRKTRAQATGTASSSS